MAPKNPLGKITETAVSLPLKATEKVADKAVGVVAGGVRVAAGLIYSTAERAKSAVGLAEPDEKQRSTRWPTDTAAAPTVSTAAVESAEEAAAAAVAREKEQEPAPPTTPSQAARQTAPAKRKPAARKTPPKPAEPAEPAEPAATVVFSTESGSSGAASTESDLGQPDTEPLLDPSTVKAVKSESEILRKAADVDKG